MTQCARPSGPDAWTESIDLLRRAYSRGGIGLITCAAVASSAAYCSSGPMSLVASRAAATICGTPSMSGLLKTPPSALTVATRGSFLNHTGCDVPPHGRARASSCWPGMDSWA